MENVVGRVSFCVKAAESFRRGFPRLLVKVLGMLLLFPLYFSC